MFVNGEYTKSTDPDEKPAVKCHPGAVGVIGVGVGLAAAMLMGMLTTAPVDCAPAEAQAAQLPGSTPAAASSTDSSSAEMCESPECIHLANHLLKNMDTTVDPCEDFFEYTCGNFIREHPIPDDKSGLSQFGLLNDKTEATLKSLLEGAGNSSGATAQRAVHYYRSCMDTEAIDVLGVHPGRALTQLVPDESGTVVDLGRLSTTIGEMHAKGIGVFFYFNAGADKRNSTANVVSVYQGSLSLPSRDYYIDKNITSDSKLVALQTHIANMFSLFDLSFPARLTADAFTVRAAAVVAFEKELAQIMLSRTEMRDPIASYNKMTIEELQQRFGSSLPLGESGGFLDTFFGLLAGDVTEVILTAPAYIERLVAVIQAAPAEAVEDFMRYSAMAAAAPHLNTAVRDEVFAFSRAVSGVQSEPPRWKTCISAVDSALGFALSKLYVDAVFSGSSKDTADEMIGEIRASFEAGLDGLQWMDEPTRAAAFEKAQAVEPKIGYPPFIMQEDLLAEHYAGFEVGADSGWFENTMAGEAWSHRRNMRKIGAPVDRTEWGMTPSTINAYYNPSVNEIVFPAAILQPPFFSAGYPKAANFGAIGVVIGHELTHGFDDQGSQYDRFGNLGDWWTPSVRENFGEKTRCLSEEYSAYMVDGEHENGNLTLGENIADNGGLTSAFRAYNAWRVSQPGGASFEEPRLPGLRDLSPEQLFFTSFATVWCGETRPAAAHARLHTDVHSPAKYRVIGTLSNSAEFAEAFQCGAETRMSPARRCKVW